MNSFSTILMLELSMEATDVDVVARATGKRLLSCMQFVLHADLILLALSCCFVSGRTF